MSWRDDANLRWLASLPGVRRAHSLASHTSFAIGGPAEFFVQADSAERLAELVPGAAARGIPCLVLGAGTNLLVADAGVEGLVVRCASRGAMVEGHRIRAEAGLKMMRLARVAADADLTGFEFAIGVPGSLGGAVYQNAGCWGVDLSSVLVEAHGFAPDGSARRWRRRDLELGYRTSAFRDGALRGSVVQSATIELVPGDGAAAKRRMATLTRKRSRTQPIRTRNCGSVFKNPPQDSAGRLVEAAGLKGARIGAAQISELHANFIVNLGEARADDVRRLIGLAQSAVRERLGVELEAEVELVGSWER